ncbi:MAG: DUF1553 domain-containing protein, partial [Planctomycetes bacterium]|nr:DUF1553 domain-containing protein [Planctomycetota bacterium]
ARVTVNRLWQLYFGAGLVKTTGDFGSQGQWPTHPRLLDWLATELIRSGWDMKAICRAIVTSATYRQRSSVSPELRKLDPDNKLLARAPRLRLSAEMVRDQALAASGMLVEHLGGPSVKPYQPKGLWKEVSGEEYPRDEGENLYRRSLYTFFKRTVAPPLLATFDSSGRETCTVRQTRTNTPLQALTLLNDVTFVEAARGLAQRVMREEAGDAARRVTLVFRLVMARWPSVAELNVLLDGYRFHLARYQADAEAAKKLVNIGELARDERLDVAELAALATVSSLILNLDEAITRE